MPQIITTPVKSSQIAEYGLYVQLAAERAKQAAQQEQRNAN